MGIFDFMGKKKREREEALRREEAQREEAMRVEREKAALAARAELERRQREETRRREEEAQAALKRQQELEAQAQAADAQEQEAIRAAAEQAKREAEAAKEAEEAARQEMERAGEQRAQAENALRAAQRDKQEQQSAEAVEREQSGEEEKKKGLFTRLWQGLSKTRTQMAGRVEELIEATEVIDEEFYEDLVDILIMSDMGVRTSDKVIGELKTRIEQQGITDARKARDILKQILKELMNQPRKPLTWPMVMMVVGVNGVGKTTTIGKLALRFKEARHSVVLAAADTFRAAAADQLQIWSERAQVPIVRHAEGADPAAVVFDGIKKAQSAEADLLIVDTAGRLHNKKNLMEELRKISRIIEREYAGAQVRTLLVIDATTGQNGLQQAREFSEVANVSGIVLTKLDGTAKGGIAVAIMDELKLPVLYIGVGEGIEDLQAFDAEAFVDAIF